jgi:hypothetical protein
MPVYLQTALGYNAFQSGLTLLPSTIALVIATVIVSRLVAAEMIRRKTLVLVSFGLMAVGALLLAYTFGPDSGGWDFALPLALVGLGMGTGVVLQDMVQISAPAGQDSEVAGLSRSATYLGQAIGVALAGAVLAGVLIASFTAAAQASPVLSPEQKQQVDEVAEAGVQATAISDAQVEAALEQQGATPAVIEEMVRLYGIAREAALTAAMLVLAISAGLGFLIILLFRRPAVVRSSS